MKKNQILEVHGLTENIAYCEAIGLSKCFEAYAENCCGEQIMYGGVGFNSSSGYVYIGLENGISICSELGNEVEYLHTNFENGEETFFNNYNDAVKFSENCKETEE